LIWKDRREPTVLFAGFRNIFDSDGDSRQDEAEKTTEFSIADGGSYFSRISAAE